ncbi:MAG TPA: symmetrical bis(5'-nucleosyl)-tetraphosphatase [Burkholderiales bacterium]|nr:symmetrical bis(5'-nucleosyl)-tetraphosphatase [Burkholderiales bacterium]
MATYAIGDLQGCMQPLHTLLSIIRFDAAHDRLWFTGDLVNRGPDSLAVLRFVKDLGNRAVTVQGNHDLHLLALAAGYAKKREDDTLDEILAAPDRKELIDWLRMRPLLYREDEYLLVHAGLLPQWSASQAAEFAAEVEAELHGVAADMFFAELYGSRPNCWDESLRGMDRLRVIVNAMTRLRFCTPEGVMDFKAKGEAAGAPPGYMPWFEVATRRSTDVRIIFGHWSALGMVIKPNLFALDTGCVWGGRLTAIRLEDQQVFQCACG